MALVNSLQPVPTGRPEAWGARHAHDPTVVRDDDGTYYMFSTDAVANSREVPAGVHVRTSADLVEWTYVGTALDGVPAEAREWSGARGLWAPEVVRWPASAGETRWHMYYSASTFGSSTSAIGLAVAGSPAGPWEDRGIVVRTLAGRDTQNAIDAAVTFDRHGDPWLTYGSFFAGIHTLRLNTETGKALTDGDLGTCIARRHPDVDRAIEGAFIHYRAEDDRYVLFVSYDSLFSTYNVRVAVAEEITGPFKDVNGAEMTDVDTEPHSVGTKILGSYRFDGDTAWLAPGHNSILTVPSGERNVEEQFMVHHVRFAEDPTQHLVQLRRVFTTANGWPIVSPQPYAGPDRETLPAPEGISGPWRVLRFAPESTDLVEAQSVTVHDDGGVTSAGEPRRVRLAVAGSDEDAGLDAVLDAVVFGSWDASRNRAALSFSGIDEHGVVYSGTQGA
ncbi:arabinan endo-1,5-alpha-L-arabinosidase [uncultured Arthrobacter sp.]|uniref:arabinan endo-1,5-alpha-L-arabinosidase n=1 Tax=uncultured Arthrobacter sp. TaxID=114050 RepID=UPI00261D4F32|nr:arabinan endo-1,5-alpha-L-arabinosidase [uncultured Arthrobacter sp.]